MRREVFWKHVACVVITFILLTQVPVMGYNGGSQWRNLYSFTAIREDETVVSWGRCNVPACADAPGPPPGLKDVKAIYSSRYSTAALTHNGTVAAWGLDWKVPRGLSNVKSIAGTDGGFCALKEDGSVVGWGGITSPRQLSNVKTLYSCANGCAALKFDGSVVAWGGLGQAPSQLTSIVSIRSNRLAMAALSEDGDLTVWGSSSYGGGTGPFTNVKECFSTRYAFAALHNDGKVTAFGDPSKGGDNSVASKLTDVAVIYSTGEDFAALMGDNSVESWGSNCKDRKVVKDVKHIYSTFWAFGALKFDGTVEIWGTLRGMVVPDGLTNVTRLFSNEVAFLALRDDGTLTSLHPSYEPPISLGIVTEVYSTHAAFAVINSDDGSVTAWGNGVVGGIASAHLTGVKALYGTTMYRALSTLPHVRRINEQGEGYPTSSPSSAPTARPSSLPTSSPTHHSSTVRMSYEHGLEFDTGALSGGLGISFIGSHSFEQLDRRASTYYLSVFVWDTGFGPVSLGQYLSFKANGKHLGLNGTIAEGREGELLCAPVSTVGSGCQKSGFVPCAFNIKIGGDDLVDNALTLETESQGLFSSACAYRSSTVYVRYELTAIVHDTPAPTPSPTMAPTKGAQNIINGLQLDINKMNIWQLLQISIAMGVVLAAAAVFLSKLRDNSKEVYHHPLPYAVFRLGMLGVELTSMVFLLVTLFAYEYSGSGVTMLCFRFFESCLAGVIVVGVYAPKSLSWVSKLSRTSRATEGGDPKDELEILDFSPYLAWEHYTTEARVYMVVSAMCVVDLAFVVFLPWRDSHFAKLSKGFPNLILFRTVSTSIILSASVSFVVQVTFLSASTFSVQRDLMFVINLILLGLKVSLIVAEFAYKLGALKNTSTALEEIENENRADKDPEVRAARNNITGTPSLESETEMVYFDNPLHAKGREDCRSFDNDGTVESVPLLNKKIRNLEGTLSRVVQRLEHLEEGANIHES